MNIFYISKIDNDRMDRITAEGYGIMGSMDLVSPAGTQFPVFYMSLRFIEGVYDLSAQGKFIYANIIKNVYSEQDEWNLLKDTVKKLPESDDRLKKWLTKKTIYRDIVGNKYYFSFKNEKILINSYNTLNFTEQKKDVVFDFSPHYERYDWWEPQFDTYFDSIEILGIADTPEELLIIQAAKEGKVLTLEQAKEMAKDWHFGGVR